MTDIVFLSRQEVRELLPPLVEQIDLVAETYRALARGRVELPPKPGIHPRANAFIHAMPAYLEEADVAALKWVSGYPDNPARGLPYISGIIILNDAETGQPTAVLDAAEITAARTAAASGVCIRSFAPEECRTVALLGCGEQGRYHLPVIRALLPEARIKVWDPVIERAEAMEGPVEVARNARGALEGAEIVITAAPIVEHPEPQVGRSVLGERYLLLPIDFDASVKTELVDDADLFVVDDVAQFESYRTAGHFGGWPKPAGNVGGFLDAGDSPRRVVCANLGIGALDAAFAAFVVKLAMERGVGTAVQV